MKKTIEIITYKYNGVVEVEWINNEWYTECQTPVYSLWIECKGWMITDDNWDKVYIEGEAKCLVWKHIINWKELIIERKEIEISL